jgi:hypothetical protein
MGCGTDRQEIKRGEGRVQRTMKGKEWKSKGLMDA